MRHFFGFGRIFGFHDILRGLLVSSRPQCSLPSSLLFFYLSLESKEKRAPDRFPELDNSPLQKRERPGKEYGCFQVVRKTKILKSKIN